MAYNLLHQCIVAARHLQFRQDFNFAAPRKTSLSSACSVRPELLTPCRSNARTRASSSLPHTIEQV